MSSRKPLEQLSANVQYEGNKFFNHSLQHSLQGSVQKEESIPKTLNVESSLIVQSIDMDKKAPNASLTVVNHDHTYGALVDTLQRKLDNAMIKIDKLSNDKRLLIEKDKRAKKRLNNLKDIVNELHQTNHLLQDGLYSLQGIEDIPSELFKRMQKSIQLGTVIKDKYPPQLRCFALTLHFYSPAAYTYVRKMYHLALLHPSILRMWYNSVDAEPGFSEECFNTLKLQKEECNGKNKRLICALIMDEMGIKKGFQRGRDGKMRGYVDIGTGDEHSQKSVEAKDALVFLVVPLNDTWKLPIAFFLINGLTATTKSNLIIEALIRLHEVGVEVTSIMFDGPPDHFAAVRLLGAKMGMNKETRPHFPHPVSSEPDVNVLIDPCHALKNIRNALADWKVIRDSENNRIEWKYIEALAVLQQEEGLRLGNKIRTMHIEFKKMIMKVYLAAQTLSSSVADAINFCGKILCLPQFEGCEATVKFIRHVDCLFDFLNVRNPWGKGFKSPLKKKNEYIWKQRVFNAIEYLSKLKTNNGQPIYSSRRYAGFVGFYTGVLTVINIFNQYVKSENPPLNMLLTYKLSQDHIELLFACIRARSGWCPNPTASQFISASKRLLIRHDVEVSSGNTQLLEKTKILNVSSIKKKKIAKLDRYDPTIYNAVENIRVEEKYGVDKNDSQNVTSIVDDLEPFLNFSWATPQSLSDFSINAVEYIAGFVIRQLSNKIKCVECIASCKKIRQVTGKEKDFDICSGTALTILKSRGGLIIPSESVIVICTTAERMFRKACNLNAGKPPIESNFPAVLAQAIYKELLLSRKKLFSELDSHFRDTFIPDTCVDHMYILIKNILMHYIEIRMFAATKNFALSITGTNIRHFLTQEIVWAHQ